MFRTIKAKYPGSCTRCGGSIYPGDSIRYGGPGRLYHFAATCGQQSGAPINHADDSEADSGGHPVRHARRASYARFSSGADVFSNAAGRCEDAPCCGCCS